MSSSGILTLIGIILAIGATVVLFILVMPEKKKDKLPGFFKVIRDIFNFKTLYIEKALKVLYTFTTLACIFVGFFLLFSVERYGGMFSSYSRWNGWTGLALMFIGPVVARIIYEYALLLVITASKLMSIDKKIPDNCCGSDPEPVKEAEPAPAPAPAPEPAPAPVYRAPVEPAPAPAPVYTAPVEPAPAQERPAFYRPAAEPAPAPAAEPAQERSAFYRPAAEAAPSWVQTPAAEPAPAPAPAPAPIPEPEPVYRYCAYCGTKYDINKGGCPNCSR